MEECWGFLYLEINKLIAFKNSKSQSRRDSETFNIYWNPLFPYYQMSISCFLEDIDPIFKISKNLLDGSSEIVGLVFSNIFKNINFQHFEVYKHTTVQKLFGFFLGSFKASWCPKDNIGFGSHGHVPKSRNHKNERVHGFPIMKSKSD